MSQTGQGQAPCFSGGYLTFRSFPRRLTAPCHDSSFAARRGSPWRRWPSPTPPPVPLSPWSLRHGVTSILGDRTAMVARLTGGVFPPIALGLCVRHTPYSTRRHNRHSAGRESPSVADWADGQPSLQRGSRELGLSWSGPRCRTAPGAMISTEWRVPCVTDDAGNALNSTEPGDDACASCHDAAGEPCVTSFKRARLRVVTPATDSPTRLHRGSPAASS